MTRAAGEAHFREAHLATYNLPLRHPLTIAHGSISVQRTLIVELQQDGFCGFGEAAASLL